MELIREYIMFMFVGTTFIVAGIVSLKMPLRYLRGYEHIKNNPKEIKVINVLKKVIGYLFITFGIITFIYNFLTLLITILEMLCRK